MELYNTRLATIKGVVSILVPALMILFVIFLSSSHLFRAHQPILSLSITFDMVFSVPLVYFLLSNRSGSRRSITMLLFTTGIIVSSIIIPKEQQYYLTKIKYWIVPILEIVTLMFIVIKVKTTLAAIKQEENKSRDFFTVINAVSAQILPSKISSLLATEVSVFYYGFVNWNKIVFDNSTYSYHKKTGTIAVISVLIFMILVECSCLHLLLSKWNFKVAWGLSILSIYTALQVFGMTRAMLKRPIQIIGNNIFINYGLFSSTVVPINTISTIELSSKEIEIDDDVKKLSPLKSLESHNTILKLNTTNKIAGVYGKQKTYTTLLLHIDENQLFKQEVEKLM